MATSSSTRVADYVFACLHGFKTLCDAPNIWESGLEKDVSQSDDTSQMSLLKLKDEQSRFMVWSGNIGAHRSGRSSLDYRLRDASNIRDHIIQILRNLIELLGDTKEILEEETAPINLERLSLEMLSDDEILPLASPSIPSELSQILSSIVESINCLFRLSVSIHNPFPHDRLNKVSSTDTSHFEPFDIDHVRTKFATASKAITERLGKANSRRRQYFKYRELHHQKLASGLDDSEVHIAESTQASSLPPGLSLRDLIPSELREAETDSVVSNTSYATSNTISGQRKVPSLPVGAQDGPFECPFCFMMISASSKRLWKKHVFSDLSPYVCVEIECPAPDQDFQHRHQWIDHVRKYHWRTWACHLGCDIALTSSKDVTAHLTLTHSVALTSNNFKSLLSICERTKPADASAICPLCNETLGNFKQYQRHVGRHQEDLALFTLPEHPRGDDESDDEFGDNEQTEAKERETRGLRETQADYIPPQSTGQFSQFVPADWKSLSDHSSSGEFETKAEDDLAFYQRDDYGRPEAINNYISTSGPSNVWAVGHRKKGSNLTRSDLDDLYY